MHILVLGANGQLGHDCLALFSAQHAVTGRDLPEVDITSPASLEATLDAVRPDAVVNCAAYTAVDRAEAESEPCHRVNALAPGLIGKACAARRVKVVHISTDYVFDGTRTPPEAYVETDVPNPQSVYGRTKREGEVALLDSGAEAAILRTAWLYGAKGHNFLKTMLRLAVTRPGVPLRVVDDQWGSPTGSWRLAGQILRVLEAPRFPGGILHATAEGHTTWFRLASAFLRLMDVPHRIEPCATSEYPTPARRPACAILENAVLKHLGLNAMVDWEQDVAEFAHRHHAELLAPYAPSQA